MAVDKLVDSVQLDSDLEDIADAIRAKSGGSSPLAFPSGFISEIGTISGGGVTNFSTGTFTLASLSETSEIVSNFEPDYIIIQGDLTQDDTLVGVKMLWIVRDNEALMVCDTNQTSLNAQIYGSNNISDLNGSSTTVNNPKANYANNVLTVTPQGNRDYTSFCPGVVYRYFLYAS